MRITNKGQALIETAALFLVLTGLLECMLGFTQWFTLRQKMLLAAREGALLYSSGHFKSDEVKQMVNDFLQSGSPQFNPARLHVELSGNLLYKAFQLDCFTVRYDATSRWMDVLGMDTHLEEKCTVKHAPQFGLQWQPLYGPPVSWWGFGLAGG